MPIILERLSGHLWIPKHSDFNVLWLQDVMPKILARSEFKAAHWTEPVAEVQRFSSNRQPRFKSTPEPNLYFWKPWMANYVAAGTFFLRKTPPYFWKPWIANCVARFFFFRKTAPIFPEALNRFRGSVWTCKPGGHCSSRVLPQKMLSICSGCFFWGKRLSRKEFRKAEDATFRVWVVQICDVGGSSIFAPAKSPYGSKWAQIKTDEDDQVDKQLGWGIHSCQFSHSSP